MLITVTDSGIGISEDGIENALTPFGQIANEHGRTHDGTGLGLREIPSDTVPPAS